MTSTTSANLSSTSSPTSTSLSNSEMIPPCASNATIPVPPTILPVISLPSVAVLSDEQLDHRVTLTAGASRVSENALVATPPIFGTLGFGKNMSVLKQISSHSELCFQDLNLQSLRTPQCAAEAPNEPDAISYWSVQPGGMVMVDYFRRFPTLAGTSPIQILHFLVEYAKHSAVAPHNFRPSMRPRMVELCSVFFASNAPSTCNEAVALLLDALPQSIIEFFELGKCFIDPPSSFESEGGPSTVQGSFSRFNAIWELFLLARISETNLVDSIPQVRAVFFRLFSCFGMLRNRAFSVCETQAHILQAASNAHTAAAVARERDLDPFFFRAKSGEAKKRNHDFGFPENSKRGKFSSRSSSFGPSPSSSSGPSSSTSSSIPSRSETKSFSQERSPLINKLKALLIEQPLSAKEGQETMSSVAFKKKLVDKDGLPVRFYCFHCGDVKHMSARCALKNSPTSRLMFASPIIKRYFGLPKN